MLFRKILVQANEEDVKALDDSVIRRVAST